MVKWGRRNIESCVKEITIYIISIKQYEVAAQVFRENMASGDDKPRDNDTLTWIVRS